MSSTSEPLALPAAKARWNRDAKVIGLVAVAHFVSHVHGMLLPPILGQVKEAFGVSYTQVALAITTITVNRKNSPWFSAAGLPPEKPRSTTCLSPWPMTRKHPADTINARLKRSMRRR